MEAQRDLQLFNTSNELGEKPGFFRSRASETTLVQLHRLSIVSDGNPQQNGQVGSAGDELNRAIDEGHQEAAGMRCLQRVVQAA